MSYAREMAMVWALFAGFGAWQYSLTAGAAQAVSAELAPGYAADTPRLVAALHRIGPEEWGALPADLGAPLGTFRMERLPDGARWTLIDGGKPFMTISAHVAEPWFRDRRVFFTFDLVPSRKAPQATDAVMNMPYPAQVVQLTGDYLLADKLGVARDDRPDLPAAQAGLYREMGILSGRYKEMMEMHRGLADPYRGMVKEKSWI